jgi:hypothetical protein
MLLADQILNYEVFKFLWRFCRYLFSCLHCLYVIFIISHFEAGNSISVFKYTLYHPLLEVIDCSKCCIVLVFLYCVRHIFSALFFVRHFWYVKSVPVQVLYCLLSSYSIQYSFVLIYQHHCRCFTWPLYCTIHPLYYAFLSQPILQTKHKANQEAFRKWPKLFQPCTAIFGMQSFCVWSKHYNF